MLWISIASYIGDISCRNFYSYKELVLVQNKGNWSASYPYDLSVSKDRRRIIIVYKTDNKD